MRIPEDWQIHPPLCRDELIARDKTNLDLFWLKDDSLEDVDALPAPGIIAADIVENLREALEHFSDVDEALSAIN